MKYVEGYDEGTLAADMWDNLYKNKQNVEENKQKEECIRVIKRESQDWENSISKVVRILTKDKLQPDVAAASVQEALNKHEAVKRDDAVYRGLGLRSQQGYAVGEGDD